MTPRASATVGWCPGALRPMASGDGLILRVKPRGGRLSIAQGRGIAEAAAAYGSGALDLTTRANLQIRGVAEEAVAPLTAVLDRLDLLDSDAGAEAVRNVVASPLAGHDPAAAFDVRPAVTALETQLTRVPALRTLPAKFGYVVDDGGSLSLRDVPADIGFEALRRQGEAVFAIRLPGAETAAGCVAAAGLAEAAAALAKTFLAACAADPTLKRMRDFVARAGSAAIAAAAGLAAPPATLAPRPHLEPPVGIRRFGAAIVLGAAAPFGRLRAEQLLALVDAAEACGADSLRLTPWRSMLMAGLAPEAAHRAAAARLAQAGLIIDPADPRLRIAACSGAPACPRASTPALSDAARLAPLLAGLPAGRGILLHVSGCAKGCAHAEPAPLLLVAEGGGYRLGRNARAGAPGSGPLASLAEAADWIAAAAGTHA